MLCAPISKRVATTTPHPQQKKKERENIRGKRVKKNELLSAALSTETKTLQPRHHKPTFPHEGSGGNEQSRWFSLWPELDRGRVFKAAFHGLGVRIPPCQGVRVCWPDPSGSAQKEAEVCSRSLPLPHVSTKGSPFPSPSH